MAIPARCESCSASFNVPDRAAGKRVRCVLCGQPVKVAASGKAAAVASLSVATDEDFGSALDDAVAAEHQAETFNEDHARRKGTADFQTGIWPWQRKTEIARDDAGLRVEVHRRLFGLNVSTAEFGAKSLAAVDRRVFVFDESKARNRRRLLLLIALLGLLAVVGFMPRDWALSQIVFGIARDLAKLAVFLLLFLVVVVLVSLRLSGGLLGFLRGFAKTGIRQHRTRYRAKAITSMHGSWRGDELDGKHVVALTMRDGKPIPLYRGSDPERADAAARKAAKITGLLVKREIQD